MLEAIRDNPVMVIIGIVAVLNILIGDPSQTEALLETAALITGGLVARAKVKPVRKIQREQVRRVYQNEA